MSLRHPKRHCIPNSNEHLRTLVNTPANTGKRRVNTSEHQRTPVNTSEPCPAGLHHLLRLYGSAIPRTLPFAIFSAALTALFIYVRAHLLRRVRAPGGRRTEGR